MSSLGGINQKERKMEEKNITEQESLELITRMISQTKKESAIGSGNMFLIWGYICTIMSLVVFGLSYIKTDSSLKWLNTVIPAVIFVAVGIVANRMSKKRKKPNTYFAKSVSGIWACMAGVFAAYVVVCLFHWETPQAWLGLYLLGLLLPGIGTFSTGIILKESWVEVCGIIGMMQGLGFLQTLCSYTTTGSSSFIFMDNPHALPLMMAVAMIVTLIIPGYILRKKARKELA